MAVPPLAHQIRAADGVLLATTRIAAGAVSYRIEEVWKASASRACLEPGAPVRVETRMDELLGYRPVNDQKVVLFFVDRGLPPHTPLELLPVVDGTVTYSPHDVSVQEKITVAQLKQRVAAL